MAKFFRMTDKMERGRTLATASNRTQKKREHISALQKRDRREKLEREIKNVIAKPSSERTKEEAKLLDAHKEKVSSLLKQMEKSLHRKRLLEEKAEEKEDSKQEIADAVAVVVKLLREDAGLQFVLHTGAGVSTSAKIPGKYLIGWFSIDESGRGCVTIRFVRFKFGRLSLSLSLCLTLSLRLNRRKALLIDPFLCSSATRLRKTSEAQTASGRSKGKASRCPCQSLKTRNRRRHTWRVKRCTTRRF